MALMAQQRMAQGYQDKAAADAAEKARIEAALKAVPVVAKGATRFDEIDKFLADNPDAQYFRIDNGGSILGSGARSYNGKYGQWDDNGAAIVSSAYDQSHRDIHRYANISPADLRVGKRGEQPTIAQQYEPGAFFKDNNIAYNTSYGMIYSRDEYGKLKNWASSVAGPNGFLSQPEQNPGQRVNFKAPGQQQQAVDQGARAPGAETLAAATGPLQSTDELTKRTLLG